MIAKLLDKGLVGDGDDRRVGVMFDRGNEQGLRDNAIYKVRGREYNTGSCI